MYNGNRKKDLISFKKKETEYICQVIHTTVFEYLQIVIDGLVWNLLSIVSKC